jgi:two-component system sensor histidine kinase CreC
MRVALEGKAYVERYTQALAHEFKAPLSSIRGAAELLAENPAEPERTRFTDNLRAESNRLQMIVDRLLELASLESRRSGTSITDVDLRAVVQDVHMSLQAAASARQVKFSVSAPAAVWVRGEKFLLEQSLRNLVQNAIEITPAGGTIVLSLQAEDACAVIAVEDSGPGVPDYALEKIFDRFYSLPRPDTGRKSSGLGLSIVREIARLHGGNVALVNRDEGGVRATLSFPVVIRVH